MCQLDKRAQPPCRCLPFQASEMADTHVYFIRPVAPTPRSECSEQKNLYRNSAVDLPKKNLVWTERHYGVPGMALSNASRITLQTSGVDVSECVLM